MNLTLLLIQLILYPLNRMKTLVGAWFPLPINLKTLIWRELQLHFVPNTKQFPPNSLCIRNPNSFAIVNQLSDSTIRLPPRGRCKTLINRKKGKLLLLEPTSVTHLFPLSKHFCSCQILSQSMSLFRLLVVTALYYGYTKFKSIMPSKKSSVEDRKDYSGKLKGRKVLYKGDADLSKVIVEAAIKWCFLEKQATPKPSPTEKQLRFKTLLLFIIAGCAGLSILIWRRTARHNQDQTQAAPLPLNISPEENLRVFLTGEAGQFVDIECGRLLDSSRPPSLCCHTSWTRISHYESALACYVYRADGSWIRGDSDRTDHDRGPFFIWP